jgi:hypothetical protein
MLTPVRNAISAVAAKRRRQSPRTLIEFASRMEFDAVGVRDQSQTLSPARLAAAVNDVSLVCDHLADTTEVWGCWLGCEAQTLIAVGAAEVAAVDSREHLRALRCDLRQSSQDARALSVSLAVLARHNGRAEATS